MYHSFTYRKIGVPCFHVRHIFYTMLKSLKNTNVEQVKRVSIEL